ncbi:MAG TPA: glycosyltransferase family 39 protein [Pyrinomonadaceae bacterium]|nr:glycosyltransferase family 39 protein [Pyrinomonadaceae bacterium]
MNVLLGLISLIVCALIVLAVPILVSPWGAEYGVATVFDSGSAILLCAVLASIAGFAMSRNTECGEFLLKIFVAGLLIRLILGTAIFVFQAQDFFGGDAITYDRLGAAQLKFWAGDKYYWQVLQPFFRKGLGGWGMVYLVAVIYGALGRNMLAVQFVNAVLGAVTAPIIYLCALEVFNNSKVARISAIAVAFFPSLVLWSSQGLKDGPIVFFLALSILATLRLNRKFDVKYLLILVPSLLALLSLRFYVFYMIAAAVAGALVIGAGKLSATKFIRQFALIVIIGLALTYLGVMRHANVQIEQYANLERIQVSRQDAAVSAKSGFSAQSDVSTSQGALTTIPVGLLYLLFAPFPWQITSLRQSITLPEMIVWWASFPLLILGLWYSIKYRLRQISPILIFTVMLSLAYSIYQGNVGNAYRQRSQLLVFYFIFVAVGYVLLTEQRAERKRGETVETDHLPAGLATTTWLRR